MAQIRPDPNAQQLDLAAHWLEPMIDELTLVGGCAVGLLITDQASPRARPTRDIDFVVEVASYVEYEKIGARVAALGFARSTQPGDPLCRWKRDQLVLDLLPPDDCVLGFRNRWYRAGIAARRTAQLPSGARLHHFDAPHLIASKLEAFDDRGEQDVLTSHDIEDVMRVIDGRPEVVREMESSNADVRSFVIERIRACLRDRYFEEALPGYFGDPTEGTPRSRIVLQRMRAILALPSS